MIMNAQFVGHSWFLTFQFQKQANLIHGSV